MVITNHLQKLQAIKEIEEVYTRNEEDKRILIMEIRSAYEKFGPEFGKEVRKMIGEAEVESLPQPKRMETLISEISRRIIVAN